MYSTQKKALRREMALRKRSLSVAQRADSARMVTKLLVADSRLAAVSVVVAFMPMPDEIDIREALDVFVARGQRVFLPVIVGNDLVFRQFTGNDCLQPEPQYGILEPVGTPLLDVAVCEAHDVAVVVPGVAFTTDGKRLGRGRGFYDRTLSLLPNNAFLVGVCFVCQVVEDLPVEPHDVAMSCVISA